MQILNGGIDYTRDSEFIYNEGESYFWQSFMYALVKFWWISSQKK